MSTLPPPTHRCSPKNRVHRDPPRAPAPWPAAPPGPRKPAPAGGGRAADRSSRPGTRRGAGREAGACVRALRWRRWCKGWQGNRHPRTPARMGHCPLGPRPCCPRPLPPCSPAARPRAASASPACCTSRAALLALHPRQLRLLPAGLQPRQLPRRLLLPRPLALPGALWAPGVQQPPAAAHRLLHPHGSQVWAPAQRAVGRSRTSGVSVVQKGCMGA